jgi:hypothetical protein
MAIHAGRDTIMPEDLKLVMQVLKVFNEGIWMGLNIVGGFLRKGAFLFFW